MMQTIRKILSFILFLFIAVQNIYAQPAVITTDSQGEKIIKGFFEKSVLISDPAFSWYAANQKNFVPDATAVKAFSENKESIHILAFGGTWCDDTKSLLPKFYALTEAAGFPDNKITLIGVDRSKKTLHHLAEAFQVVNVPTFIVLKNGKEIGRVVEYGRYGMIDKELGEIVNANKN
ncbi:MAG: thioredoxin family protein [Flavisolibacter sp.]|jgi:thiol-disulfide isomerase/thioredoxin|nr:thioredoxin family protein [Flavisolibacter sp.]